jgi:hypothetical protein
MHNRRTILVSSEHLQNVVLVREPNTLHGDPDLSVVNQEHQVRVVNIPHCRIHRIPLACQGVDFDFSSKNTIVLNLEGYGEGEPSNLEGSFVVHDQKIHLFGS